MTPSPPRRTGISTLPRGGGELKFTLPSRQNSIGSTRCHGTSCRDVDCSIHVRVRDVAAGPAPEVGLALARLPVPRPAPRARLRSVGGYDLLHPADGFVLQPLDQTTPATAEDAAVQACLLPNVPFRRGDRPLGRAGHRPDAEVFHADQVESSRKIGGGLFDPVLSPVRFACHQSRDRSPGPGTPVRPALSPGETAPQPEQADPLSRLEPRAVQELTGRQCSGDDHATVHTDDLRQARRRDRVRCDRERQLPATGPIAGHPVRLRPRQRTGQPKLDPSDFRDEHPSPLSRQHLRAGCLCADDTKALVPSSLALLSRRRSQAVTGHIEDPSNTHRHFLKGGRWRYLLAGIDRVATPSMR